MVVRNRICALYGERRRSNLYSHRRRYSSVIPARGGSVGTPSLVEMDRGVNRVVFRVEGSGGYGRQ